MSHGSAEITENVSKASSGAVEFMPIMKTPDMLGFVTWSMQNDWQFFVAMPTPNQKTLKKKTKKSPIWYDLLSIGDPLSQGPVALIIGSECKS